MSSVKPTSNGVNSSDGSSMNRNNNFGDHSSIRLSSARAREGDSMKSILGGGSDSAPVYKRSTAAVKNQNISSSSVSLAPSTTTNSKPTVSHSVSASLSTSSTPSTSLSTSTSTTTTSVSTSTTSSKAKAEIATKAYEKMSTEEALRRHQEKKKLMKH
eukprot:TRINITY_DN376_c0_g1_i1.p1 TRINITY_DN376_c0_g1~~TRINITY_DN376_c0_g1_i1.p1  ORF type:complete len:158 (-),score=70.57 TRINITY_DN376_c0_g1_i1:246-719(-)